MLFFTKKQILCLVFLFSVGSHPIVQSNDIASNASPYTARLVNYFTGPEFAIHVINHLVVSIMLAVLAQAVSSKIQKIWVNNFDRSASFKPTPKSQGILRTEYYGDIPEEITELIENIEQKKYQAVRRVSNNPIRCIALNAESGMGKTYLSRLLVTEANCPVFMVSLNDFQKAQTIGSEGTSVEKLFKSAKEKAIESGTNVAIICIDELHNFKQFGAGDVKDRANEATNSFIVQIDGQNTQEDYKDITIVILGTTNHFDKCDTAIRSRFTEVIPIYKPRIRDRAAYIKNALQECKCSLIDDLSNEKESDSLFAGIIGEVSDHTFRELKTFARAFSKLFDKKKKNSADDSKFKLTVDVLSYPRRIFFNDTALESFQQEYAQRSLGLSDEDLQFCRQKEFEHFMVRNSIKSADEFKVKFGQHRREQFDSTYHLCRDIYPLEISKKANSILWQDHSTPYRLLNPDEVLMTFETTYKENLFTP